VGRRERVGELMQIVDHKDYSEIVDKIAAVTGLDPKFITEVGISQGQISVTVNFYVDQGWGDR
jgi:hypothetical protein